MQPLFVRGLISTCNNKNVPVSNRVCFLDDCETLKFSADDFSNSLIVFLNI